MHQCIFQPDIENFRSHLQQQIGTPRGGVMSHWGTEDVVYHWNLVLTKRRGGGLRFHSVVRLR
jgi:hypothetical protein